MTATWTLHGVSYPLERHHRPGYASGATISLGLARWVATHAIIAMEALDAETVKATGKTLRLKASDGTHVDTHCSWGLVLNDGIAADGTRTCVQLVSNVQNEMNHILAWEAAFPDEPKVGSLRQQRNAA